MCSRNMPSNGRAWARCTTRPCVYNNVLSADKKKIVMDVLPQSFFKDQTDAVISACLYHNPSFEKEEKHATRADFSPITLDAPVSTLDFLAERLKAKDVDLAELNNRCPDLDEQ